jgi:hypothetical protein
MFAGAAGLSLAAQVTEWLDTHPAVFEAFSKEPEMLSIVERYGKELTPFFDKYTSNLAKKPETKPAESGKETPAETPAEPDATLQAEVASLKSLLSECGIVNERIAGELSGVKAERDELAGKLTKAEADLAALKADRDEACRKLAAIEAGSPPVSAAPAPEVPAESAWKKAQKAGSQKRA